LTAAPRSQQGFQGGEAEASHGSEKGAPSLSEVAGGGELP
jgi:hypothetical protein